MRRAAAAWALTALMASPALAAPERVAFAGPDAGQLDAVLYRPAGPGPFPAVVALHGCGGLYGRDGALDARFSDWGERLAAQGFLVLLPDSFGSRGLGSQCRQARREVRASRERVEDAFAAKSYLQGRPDVKGSAVSLLGWSNGGTTVLNAVRRDAGIPPGRDFAKAVALYPGCALLLRRGWRDRVPLLILSGAADDWTGAAPCEAMASEASRAGDPVAFRSYPGAYHDFDLPDRPVRERRGLATTINGDGVAHTGTDPAARADALVRVPAFLAR